MPDSIRTYGEILRIFRDGQAVGAINEQAVRDLFVSSRSLVEDLSIASLRVGRGPGAVVTNAVLGYQALDANTTGLGNVAIGHRALASNTTGYTNTAVGQTSLVSNTGGIGSTALGFESCYKNTANWNIGLGYQALRENTTGIGNTAVGVTSLLSNVNGDYNTAVGIDALYSNIGGYSNAAVGADALGFNTNGFENVAVGFNALFANTLGQRNTALGFRALKGNLTGNLNVAVGYWSGAYETGSSAFYINNADQGSSAAEKANSLLYGQFGATASGQTLQVNASLSVNGRLQSLRTLAASSVTVSAGNTNVQVNEIVFTIGGASGASLCIHSGGTVYIFNSAISAKAT